MADGTMRISQVLSFNEPEAGPDAENGETTDGGASVNISISLDSDANTVNGVTKTTFAPGDSAYLKVMTNAVDPYRLAKSGGKTRKTATDVPLEIEDEEVTFLFTDTGEIDYPPSGGVTYSWIGNNPGVSPTFAGKEISLSREIEVGVLSCNYVTLFDRWLLESEEEGDIIVAVKVGDQVASVTVTFSNDAEEGENERSGIYDLVYYDYCDPDNVVPGIPVYMNNTLLGITDVNGRVAAGYLAQGEHYTLRHDETVDVFSSADDELSNDGVTI
jgi:hypothetical protein